MDESCNWLSQSCSGGTLCPCSSVDKCWLLSQSVVVVLALVYYDTLCCLDILACNA